MRNRILFIILLIAAYPASGAEPNSTRLFTSGQEGYRRYRIPSLIVTARGTVLAICEGRKDGGGLTGNIDLVLKRSADAGKTWGPLEVIADDGDNTLGNPCVLVDDRATIWLLFTRSRGNEIESDITAGKSKDATRVWLTRSIDDGKTWDKPIDLTDDLKAKTWTWYGSGPGTGIQLKSGRLVFPCYHYDLEAKRHASHAVYSDDHGKTWKRGEISGAEEMQTTECHVAERLDGTLLLSARTIPVGDNRRTISTSANGGQSWAKPKYDDGLYDPGCEAALLRLPAEKDKTPLWLYAHPAGPKGRRNLTVRVSHDEGETWKESRLLRSGDAQYSSLALLDAGTVGCFYDAWVDGNYQMYFTRFALDWLLGRAEAP